MEQAVAQSDCDVDEGAVQVLHCECVDDDGVIEIQSGCRQRIRCLDLGEDLSDFYDENGSGAGGDDDGHRSERARRASAVGVQSKNHQKC